MYAVVFEVAVGILYLATIHHAIKRHNGERLLVACGIVGTIMWLQEYLAMNVLSSNLYHYNGFSTWLGDVPLAIVLSWIVVYYVSFTVSVKTHSYLVGALAGSTVDLALEPLAFLWGLWIWRPDTYSILTYWTAPIGNAFGWLLWCFIGAQIFNHFKTTQ